MAFSVPDRNALWSRAEDGLLVTVPEDDQVFLYLVTTVLKTILPLLCPHTHPLPDNRDSVSEPTLPVPPLLTYGCTQVYRLSQPKLT